MEKFLHTEKELIKKLQEGDPFAFEVLFYKYRNKVKGFALKMVPTQLDPEEIVQEVFVKLWLKRDMVNPEKDFQSFLFSVAKNLILDHLKSAVNKRLYFTGEFFQQDFMMDDAADQQGRELAEARLYQLIEQIPERRREIFCLSRFEGLSYKQIAGRLKISENTVDSQIRNALAFLRDHYSKMTLLLFCWF